MKKKLLLFTLVMTLLFTGCSSNGGEKESTDSASSVKSIVLTSKETEDMRNQYEVEVDSLKAEDFSKESTMHKILYEGKLIVATNATYPPFEFLTIVDGDSNPGGIDMEMARLLAKKMNVELEIVDTSFESLITGLSNGMYDLVLAGMNKDPERDKQVDFSEDYYFPNLYLLQRKSDIDLYTDASSIPDDFKWGNQNGTVQEKITNAQFPKAVDNSLYMENYTELILALQAGQIDGILLEDVIAKAFVSRNNDLVINEKISYPGETGFAMAFKDGDKEFQEYLNNFISEIVDNGTFEKIENDAVRISGSSIEE